MSILQSRCDLTSTSDIEVVPFPVQEMAKLEGSWLFSPPLVRQ